MGKIGAFTGAELLAEEHENVAAGADGVVRLSSRNRVYDPGFRDFGGDGDLEGWTLSAPPAPDGWGVFIKGGDMQYFSEQNPAPLSLAEDAYWDQTEALVGGRAPWDDAGLAIARPDTPRVSTIRMPDAGFPEGWYTVSYALIATGPVGRSPNVTRPAPRSEPFFLNQGEGFAIQAPQNLSRGTRGVVFYLSEPRQDALQAQNAPLFGQIRVPYNNNYKNVYFFRGPFRKIDREKPENHTKIGRFNIRPRSYIARSRASLGKMTVQVAFTFIDNNGRESNLQQPSGWIKIRKFHDDRKLAFRPRRFPHGAVRWKPYWRVRNASGKVSRWRTLGTKNNRNFRFPRDRVAYIYRAWHKGWPDVQMRLYVMDPPDADNTGLPDPDEALETPTVIDLQSSSLPPANYRVRTALYFGDKQSRPSPPVRVQIQDEGFGIRIKKPLFVNRFENPEAVSSGNYSHNAPVDWIRPLPQQTTTTPGRVRVNRSGANGGSGNTDLLETTQGWPADEIVDNVLRMTIRMINRTSGKVRAILDEYDDLGNRIASQTIADVRDGVRDIVRRVRRGANGHGAINISNNTRRVRVRLQGRGEQNFDVEVSNLGLFRGDWSPLKRWAFSPAPAAEDPAASYPHGGYCYVVEDPDDGAYIDRSGQLAQEYMRDGAIQGNGFVASSGVEVGRQYSVSEHSAFGARVPAGESITYTYSGSEVLTSATIGARIRWEVAPSGGPEGFLQLRDGAGQLIAEVSAHAGGDLRIRSPLLGSNRFVYEVGTVEAGFWEHMELQVENLGTTSGAIRFYSGTDREDLQLQAEITGVDMTSRAALGSAVITGANSSIKHVSEPRVTRYGSHNIERLPGNYIEYYGPVGTPMSEEYGPRGLKVPVTPGEMGTFSAYLAIDGVKDGTSLLHLGLFDAEGNIVEDLGPLYEANAQTARRWQRYHMTFAVPENAAYLEVTHNRLGEGRFRLQAPMYEQGEIATEYTDEYAPAGYIRRVFPAAPPGVTAAHPYYRRLAAQKRLLSIYAVETTDHEEEDEQTSVQVRFRSGPTPNGPWSEYTSDLAALPVDDYYDVRVDMATGDLTKTPEVRGVAVHIERDIPILCDPEGREYPGGALVSNLPPAPAVRRLVEEHEFDDGGKGFTEWGNPDEPPRVLEGFSVFCFTPEGLERITNDAGRTEEGYIVEAYGRLYALGYVSFEFEHDRDSDTPAGYTLIKSSEASAEVVVERDLEASEEAV